jgi:MFS family permease
MTDAMATRDGAALSYRHALRFILLVGAVSLFADMTYEGARSITGPYLAMLGASATAVGFVAGFGELIGYAVRLASGYLSDRTGRYWAVTIFGYCVNLLAVPLLALAGSWEGAAVLIVLSEWGGRSGRRRATPCCRMPPDTRDSVGASACTKPWTRPGQSSGRSRSAR